MRIQTDFSKVKSQAKKPNDKRMLEVKEFEDHIAIYVNFSSLDLIQTCMRKAFYTLHEGLEPLTARPALITGTGVHKAMETWYCAPKENRKRSSAESDENIQLLLAKREPLQTGPCTRTAAIHAYLDAIEEIRDSNDLGNRDPQIVTEILDAYFDHYLNDDFEVYQDDLGPFVERDFEFQIAEVSPMNFPPVAAINKPVRIYIHGAIDEILRDTKTGELIVIDHKTTSSLGKDFLARIKPNFQYVGYFWAAKYHFGLPVKRFMVNGIQIAKLKRDFKRQFTYISDSEIEELSDAITHAAIRYLTAERTGDFPMSTPNACVMWGQCEYKIACEAQGKVREGILKNEYQQRPQSGEPAA